MLRPTRLLLGSWLAMLGGCTSSTGETSERAEPETPTVAIVPPEQEGSGMVESGDLDRLALACEGEPLRQHLSALSRDELEALAKDAPTSVRMLAMWEHDRSFAEDGTLKPDSVDRLEHQIALALGPRPPPWWIDQLESAKLRPGDSGGPPYYDIGLTADGDRRGDWKSGPGGARVRSDGAMLLSETKDQLSYDFSMGRVVLGPLPTEPGAMIEHARAQGATTVYYATFSQGSGGFRFPLRAVGADGTVAWTAEVCGPNRQILGGIGHLTVEIVVLGHGPASRDTPLGAGIAVFTAETHGVALDVFDSKTGERLLAWSSDFWFAR